MSIEPPGHSSGKPAASVARFEVAEMSWVLIVIAFSIATPLAILGITLCRLAAIREQCVQLSTVPPIDPTQAESSEMR